MVERRNQTIIATARSIMKARSVPARFWGEAVSTAVYLLNRSPTKSVEGKTPYEVWYGRKPDVSYLRVFGYVAHVKTVKPHPAKLDDRSTPMVFFGYEPGSAAYRVYDPARQRVHVTRDVVFDEQASWNWSEPGVVVDGGTFTVNHYTYTVARTTPLAATPAAAGVTRENAGTAQERAEAEPGSVVSSASSTSSTPSTGAAEPPPQPRHSMTTRARDGIVQPNHIYDDYVMVHEDDLDYVMVEEDEQHLGVIDEPHSFAEAEHDNNWRRAMDEEMASIIDNKTWRLVDLPASFRPIGLKWVYKLKRDANGDVQKYKARLVAKGYMSRGREWTTRRCLLQWHASSLPACFSPLLHKMGGLSITWTDGRQERLSQRRTTGGSVRGPATRLHHLRAGVQGATSGQGLVWAASGTTIVVLQTRQLSAIARLQQERSIARHLWAQHWQGEVAGRRLC